MDIFVFFVDNDFFAFKVQTVQEVTEMRRLVKVPGSLGYIKGAINYKGTLYCIIDPSLLFKHNRTHDDNKAERDFDIIILSDDRYKVGFLAEKIIGVKSIDGSGEEAVQAAKATFLNGVCKVDGFDVKLIDEKEVFNTIERAAYNLML